MADTAALADQRITKLSTASLRRVLEPEELFDWRLGDGQVIPDELLSIHGLDVPLSSSQRGQLAREEVAAMLAMGIRFESVLLAGFGLQLAATSDVTDPRVAYILHELGEETRHSRAFARLIEALEPTATNPLMHGVPLKIASLQIRSLIHNPALFTVLVLAGEEIPDLLQHLASEHPDTDPLIAAVNRYHRAEEARHLSFARTVLPEMWDEASAVERFRVLRVAPIGIRGLFDLFVHPGVYESIGLPGWKTWRAVRSLPTRVALRHAATRPIVAALRDAGAVTTVPKGWRDLAGVDHAGNPVPGDVSLPGNATA